MNCKGKLCACARAHVCFQQLPCSRTRLLRLVFTKTKTVTFSNHPTEAAVRVGALSAFQEGKRYGILNVGGMVLKTMKQRLSLNTSIKRARQRIRMKRQNALNKQVKMRFNKGVKRAMSIASVWGSGSAVCRIGSSASCSSSSGCSSSDDSVDGAKRGTVMATGWNVNLSDEQLEAFESVNVAGVAEMALSATKLGEEASGHKPTPALFLDRRTTVSGHPVVASAWALFRQVHAFTFSINLKSAFQPILLCPTILP